VLPLLALQQLQQQHRVEQQEGVRATTLRTRRREKIDVRGACAAAAAAARAAAAAMTLSSRGDDLVGL
jgi:hypothetical protein